MITIQKDKLIIEIQHPCPQEFVCDIKESIIISMQDHDPDSVNKEEIESANHTLLELLKFIE